MFLNRKQHFSGNKAKGLYLLQKNGFNIPLFFVLQSNVLEEEFGIPDFEKSNKDFNTDNDLKNFSQNQTNKILQCKPSNQFQEKVFQSCLKYFGKEFNVSVRSSAMAEDTEEASFAGQYNTYLNVAKSGLMEAIQQCMVSSVNYNALKYMHLKTGEISHPKMSIIIQSMVLAKYSGVIFTRNPNGNMNNLVVSIGKGSGEGIVSGTTKTNNYFYDRFSHNILQPSQNKTDKEKSEKFEYALIRKLAKIALDAEKVFKISLDIEFTIDKNQQIFLLQARPISTLKLTKLKILDNTNISESYPGITLPLSISFAKKNYNHVFKGIAKAIKIEFDKKCDTENILANLIGDAAGRVYYRLDNWYKVMALIVPGKKGIKNWEQSVGLSSENLSIQKVSIFKRMVSLIKIFQLVIHHKNWSKIFFANFDAEYKKLVSYDYKGREINEVFDFYNKSAGNLFSSWYPTLVNDLIAFKSFGLLKSLIESLNIEDNENLTNDLLCGIPGVESEKPIIELLQMVKVVKSDLGLNELFLNEEPLQILEGLQKKDNEKFIKKINQYLDLYGDRVMAELKLETQSLKETPWILIEMIQARMDSGFTADSLKIKQNEIRIQAEKKIINKFSRLSFKKIWFKIILNTTKETIKNRENMRFCRTRAYGISKQYFKAIGLEMNKKGIIENQDDIYYLNLDHVYRFCKNYEKNTLAGYVKEQKEKYAFYKTISLQDRLIYVDDFFLIENNWVSNTENTSKLLKGTGVSKGLIKAEAVVLESPKPNIDVRGKIVITKITDPGWIFIMSQAAGLISEKGSLLSHTAIVGRELGIPTIVGVGNACMLIKNGSTIEIDGTQGIIKIF